MNHLIHPLFRSGPTCHGQNNALAFQVLVHSKESPQENALLLESPWILRLPPLKQSWCALSFSYILFVCITNEYLSSPVCLSQTGKNVCNTDEFLCNIDKELSVFKHAALRNVDDSICNLYYRKRILCKKMRVSLCCHGLFS